VDRQVWLKLLLCCCLAW